ncbi:MAG: hypothetical protein Kow0069_06330 [Promethearchaeota archaeon]
MNLDDIDHLVTVAGNLSVKVKYAFQVSVMVGIKEEVYELPTGATLRDLVDAVMARHGTVKNFDLYGKYYTIFDDDGRIYNVDREGDRPLADGEHLHVEILNLDGG